MRLPEYLRVRKYLFNCIERVKNHNYHLHTSIISYLVLSMIVLWFAPVAGDPTTLRKSLEVGVLNPATRCQSKLKLIYEITSP